MLTHEDKVIAQITYDFVGYDANDGVTLQGTQNAVQQFSLNTTDEKRVLGTRLYELSNHLGNVLVTVSDKKIPVFENVTTCAASVTYNNTFTHYTADVQSTTDYSPFGAPLAGRTFNSPVYRYGANTNEKEDEIYGEGNLLSAEYWMFDARLGRRWNVDPLGFPGQSPYAAFNNNPVVFNDPFGLTGEETNKKGGETEGPKSGGNGESGKEGGPPKANPGDKALPSNQHEYYSKMHEAGADPNSYTPDEEENSGVPYIWNAFKHEGITYVHERYSNSTGDKYYKFFSQEEVLEATRKPASDPCEYLDQTGDQILNVTPIYENIDELIIRFNSSRSILPESEKKKLDDFIKSTSSSGGIVVYEVVSSADGDFGDLASDYPTVGLLLDARLNVAVERITSLDGSVIRTEKIQDNKNKFRTVVTAKRIVGYSVTIQPVVREVVKCKNGTSSTGPIKTNGPPTSTNIPAADFNQDNSVPGSYRWNSK